MNRFIIFFICTAIIILSVSGCAAAKHEETFSRQTSLPIDIPQTLPPTLPPQPTEETKVPASPIHLLIIGNSHSVDAFHLLYQVFEDQMPGREIVLGVLYYGGCSIAQHVRFGLENKPVYSYYKNTDGHWEITKEMDMASVLKDDPWNMVMFQAAKTDLDETLNEKGRRDLEAIVSEHTTETPQFLWHTSWPSPNDNIIFSPDFIRPVPKGYKENLVKLYGFDPVNQFTVLTDMAKAHILPDRHYQLAVCTGAAIMYAHLALGERQQALWRDYTHLSDYGRLIAAYAMYTQLTRTPLTSIGINTVWAAQRYSGCQYLGDLAITEQMKQVILQAANHALEDPWTVPDKQSEIE